MLQNNQFVKKKKRSMLKHNKRTVGIRVRHIEKIEPSVKPITFLYRYILEVLAEEAIKVLFMVRESGDYDI